MDKTHFDSVQGRYFCRSQTKLREGNVFTPVCDSVRRGVSVHRGLCQGGLCQGGSLFRETLHTVEERAVYILLECILVDWTDRAFDGFVSLVK